MDPMQREAPTPFQHGLCANIRNPLQQKQKPFNPCRVDLESHFAAHCAAAKRSRLDQNGSYSYCRVLSLIFRGFLVLDEMSFLCGPKGFDMGARAMRLGFAG